jgi:hypothetical protein
MLAIPRPNSGTVPTPLQHSMLAIPPPISGTVPTPLQHSMLAIPRPNSGTVPTPLQHAMLAIPRPNSGTVPSYLQAICWQPKVIVDIDLTVPQQTSPTPPNAPIKKELSFEFPSRSHHPNGLGRSHKLRRCPDSIRTNSRSGHRPNETRTQTLLVPTLAGKNRRQEN